MSTLSWCASAAVQQRLLQALVGILVLDVLADHPDRDLVRSGCCMRSSIAVQRVRSRGRRVELQQPQDDVRPRPRAAKTSGTS